MKQAILFFLFLFIGSQVQSQESFSVDTYDSISVNVADLMDYPDVNIKGFIKNTTTSNQSYSWRREIIYIDTLIAQAICDNKACYEPDFSEPPSPFPLQADSSGLWDMHLYGYNYYAIGGFDGTPLVGSVIFDVTIFNFVNESDSVRLRYFMDQYDNTSSVEQIAQGSFKVYPNPANDWIQIRTDANLTKAEVYTLNGKRVKTYNQISNYKLDIQDLQQGMYVVKLYTQDKKVNFQKFIKN